MLKPSKVIRTAEAVINYIPLRGAIVHLELNAEAERELFDVELSREGFRSLGLQVGERVYATLRNPRIFVGCGGTSDTFST